MYRYKYNTSYNHKSRRASRATFLAGFVATLVVAGVGYIVYDLIKHRNIEQPVSQTSFSSVQGASVNIFRTPYYQFQASDSWKEVPSESKENRYVYRSYKGPLVERDLVININRGSGEVVPLVRTTRVLPVNTNGEGRLLADGTADKHCKDSMPKNAANIPTQVTQRKVTFICTPDAIVYQVEVGLIGGSTNMLLTRPDGSKASYSITYRDLTFNSSDADLRNIVQTFQTR